MNENVSLQISTQCPILISQYDYQLPGFGESAGSNMDVLQDFDFDSFLHQDADGVDNFGFDSFPLDDGGQIGAD